MALPLATVLVGLAINDEVPLAAVAVTLTKVLASGSPLVSFNVNVSVAGVVPIDGVELTRR